MHFGNLYCSKAEDATLLMDVSSREGDKAIFNIFLALIINLGGAEIHSSAHTLNPLRPKLILVCQKMQKIARIRNNKSLIFKSTTHFSKKLYIVLIYIKQGIQ